MKEQRFLVVGAGRSGVSAAKMLIELKKDVTVFDSKADFDTAAFCKKVGAQVPFILGSAKSEELTGFDVCVVSPGVSLETDIMKAVAAAEIPVWSEIELAYRFDKGQVIAITGTNGKTTTTTLVYEIVKEWNKNTLLVGNIEIPYTGLALTSVEGGFTVAEISSFQLETMRTVKPRVSAVLNITPDHLDRHKTMENYSALKMSIAKNQDKNDYCVLNFEDEYLREHAKELDCSVVFFSSRRALENGVYLENGEFIIALGEKKEVLCRTDEVKLVGTHNFENIMAAVAMTYCLGVPTEIIRKVTKEFTAVEHRIEFVREVNGVKYYNDSKGTNTDAAIKAIDAMPSKTVLIGGGYDKKSDYTDWVSRFPGKVRLLVLLGQTKESIAEACEKVGFSSYVFAESLQEAVKICAENAKSGDCVLLSPACASWGMFSCYQERGNIFKELVRAL